MGKLTFSTLPPEIHVGIAEHRGNSDLLNLCLTSKWVNERCLHVLYRHVDLERYAPRLDLRIKEKIDPALAIAQPNSPVLPAPPSLP